MCGHAYPLTSAPVLRCAPTAPLRAVSRVRRRSPSPLFSPQYTWIYSWATWQRLGGAFFDKDLGTVNDITTFAAAVSRGYEELIFPRARVPTAFVATARTCGGGWGTKGAHGGE